MALPGERCLFYVCGAVDGVTDAVVAAEPEAGDDDDWRLQRIVVEVKHRVGSVKVPPPLYDQLQTVVYMQMMEAEAADLVQCVRSAGGGVRVHVSRLELHAPPMAHAAYWRSHVVPRLYAFANTVHQFRRDAAARYAYLVAPPPQRTAMLLAELPHLSGIA